jgi:hypothetical protein
MGSGENVTGTTKGKNIWCTQFACWLVHSASYLTDIFSLFVYMLENPRLTTFALQLNQAIFYPLSLSDHQTSKPVSQDIQLQWSDAGQLENQGQRPLWTCVLSHSQVEPLNCTLKRQTFSLRSGMTELWQINSPYPSLCQTNNKSYFPFLKTLLSHL